LIAFRRLNEIISINAIKSPNTSDIAILLIIPVYLLSWALASIPFWFNSSEDWQTLTENPLFLQQMAMFSYGLTTIFLLLSILLVPFWQSLNSVIYNHVLDQKKKWALLGSV
jgi:hypothetical protein